MSGPAKAWVEVVPRIAFSDETIDKLADKIAEKIIAASRVGLRTVEIDHGSGLASTSSASTSGGAL